MEEIIVGRFVALDVETANYDPGSICQIGLVWFDNVSVTRTWQTLVDPECHFDSMNVSIHGISQKMVKGAPKIPEVFKTIHPYLDEQIVVHHTPFDRLSINRAAENYFLAAPDFKWLDTARVVRRAYDQFRQTGYSLSNLADHFGIVYTAHNAAEDARATGLVLLRAIADSKISLEDWTTKAYKRIVQNYIINKSGNPDGPLYGEVVVFTGELYIPRREAAELADKAGCRVTDNVTSKTTILVVGSQDLSKLAGHEKSSKHRKADDLIQSGQPLRIISESDFMTIINY